MTHKVATFDAITGEYAEREMNAQELLEYETRVAEGIARETEATAKAEAKAALLTRLGITAEEAALLLGGN
jgi:hypothetical protein